MARDRHRLPASRIIKAGDGRFFNHCEEETDLL